MLPLKSCMPNLLLIALVPALLIAGFTVGGESGEVAALSVTDAWVGATTCDASESARPCSTGFAFMTIHNAGDDAERLVGVSIAPDLAGSVKIYAWLPAATGDMRLLPVDEIDVFPHDSVEFNSQPYQMWLIDLKRSLVCGDMVPMTLTFASGVTLSVTAEVRPLDSRPDTSE